MLAIAPSQDASPIDGGRRSSSPSRPARVVLRAHGAFQAPFPSSEVLPLGRSQSAAPSRKPCALDARKSQVGDVVKQSKAIQDRDADLLGRNLRTTLEELLFDVAGQQLHRIVTNRTVLARGANSRDELLPEKWLALTGALYYEEHSTGETLEGGETKATTKTLPATANRRALLDLARVHDPVIGVGTARTSHRARLTAPRSKRALRSSRGSLRREGSWVLDLKVGAAEFTLEAIRYRPRISRGSRRLIA